MRPAWVLASAAVLLLLVPAAQAQEEEPVEVKVTVALINFSNYDAATSTYTLDFYLVLEWDTAQAPGFNA